MPKIEDGISKIQNLLGLTADKEDRANNILSTLEHIINLIENEDQVEELPEVPMEQDEELLAAGKDVSYYYLGQKLFCKRVKI
jgi:hypothetical protein